MAIFKSKNFKTDFQCEKLKTTKIETKMGS